MSKITVEFDTQTKELKVNVDGKNLSDVSSATFFTDYLEKDKGYVELSIVESNEDEKYTKLTRIMAGHDNFVEVDRTAEEIASLIKNKKNV